MFKKFFAVILAGSLIFGSQQLIEAKTGSSSGRSSSSFSSSRSSSSGFSKSSSWSSKPSAPKAASSGSSWGTSSKSSSSAPKPINAPKASSWGSSGAFGSSKSFNNPVKPKAPETKPSAFNSLTPSKSIWGTSSNKAGKEGKNNTALFSGAAMSGTLFGADQTAKSLHVSEKPNVYGNKYSDFYTMPKTSAKTSTDKGTLTLNQNAEPQRVYQYNNDLLPLFLATSMINSNNNDQRQRSAEYVRESKLEDINQKKSKTRINIIFTIVFMALIGVMVYFCYQEFKTKNRYY
jgi:hypothetical protein